MLDGSLVPVLLGAEIEGLNLVAALPRALGLTGVFR